MKFKTFFNFIPAIILCVIIIFTWELSVRFLKIDPTILPAPSLITNALILNWQIIATHTMQTILETILGFGFAVLIGVFFAFIIDSNIWIKKAIYPLLIISQTIPMIALAPLFLLWFGFDMFPKVLIIILYCFFPITISFADGLSQTNADLLKLLKSMNASFLQTLILIRIPNAMPQFFSGLRIAATYSVTGAIVSEYIGAYQGLGIYMQEVAHSHATALVFATILVITILSLLFFGLIILIEKLCLPWEARINK